MPEPTPPAPSEAVTPGRSAADRLLSQSAFAIAPLGLAQSDGAGCIQRSNLRLRSLLGVPGTDASPGADPLAGVALTDCIFPAERAAFAADLARLRSAEGTAERELRLCRDGGESTWVRWSALSVHEPATGTYVCLSYFLDLTERVCAEQALRESESRYRRLAEATTEAVVLHDAGTIVDVNPALCAMFGYSREELIGKSVRHLTHPQSHAELDAHIRSGREDPYEGYGLRKDGSTLLASVTAKTVQLEDRSVRVACLRDITEQRRAEVALRESEERFRVFSNLSSEALYLIDKGIIIECNDAACQMSQVQREELLGQPVFDFIAPEEHATVRAAIQADKLEPYASTFVRKDGSRFPVRVAGRLLPFQGRMVRGTAVRDMSAMKMAEAALRESVEHQAALRAQTELLAELSTPLIPLTAEIVVMPLVGSLSSQRADQVLATLLEGIGSSGARTAILDITGVRSVDTHTASVLLRAAQAVRLLGAEVVLTGLRPEVAKVLVGLGIDLRGVVTRSTLQSGIEYAQRGRGEPGTR